MSSKGDDRDPILLGGEDDEESGGKDDVGMLPKPVTNGNASGQESLGQRYARIFSVVALYWFVSITMVFVNKSLLSGQKDFDAPFFVTWFQCVVTVIGCYAVSGLAILYPQRINFPVPQINK